MVTVMLFTPSRYEQKPGADAGDEVIPEEPFGPPDAFEIVPEHVQREHVDEDVEELMAVVQKHVAHELPDHELVGDAPGYQSEVGLEKVDAGRPAQQLQNEDPDVDQDQRLDGSG